MSSLPTSEPSASVGPDRLTQNLLTLLRTPTEVPAGAHELHPGDARIVSAVEEVVVPRIAELGPDELRRHPDGDVVARFGPAGDDGLLLQTYIVSQHGNLMSEPHDARVEDGGPYGIAGPVARGQGANQNKGPMAAALSAVAQRPATLRRPVLLTVNTEGRSHDGSRRIIDEVGTRAAAWLGLKDAQLYLRYHEALTAAGIGVLVFDYRGFGVSPRGIRRICRHGVSWRIFSTASRISPLATTSTASASAPSAPAAPVVATRSCSPPLTRRCALS